MSESQPSKALEALLVSLSEQYGATVDRVRSLYTPLYWEGHRMRYPDPRKYELDQLPAQASRSLRTRDGRPTGQIC